MSRVRRILHPSDFSRASGAAFSKAVELAKTNNAELLVVHVLAPILPMLGDGYVSPKVHEDLVASARGYGKKNLDALVAKAKKAGVRATSVLLEGVPHAQIAGQRAGCGPTSWSWARTGAPGSRSSFSAAWPDASSPSLRAR
jgi:nucleotide-binding universal stress UspA family protein